MTKSKSKKISKQSLKKASKLFRYLKPYRLKFAIGMLFLLLSSLTGMVFPMLTGKLIDATNISEAESQGLFDMSNINSVALALLLVFAAQAVFSFFRIYIFSDVTESMLAKLRRESYEHIIKLPMQFFNTRRVGELNSRIAADIALLQETFTTTLAEFLRQFITIFVGVALLAYFSMELTLMMLASIPVMAVVAVFFGRFIKKLSKQTQDKVAESNVVVEETLSGIANVKAFTNELFETLRYNRLVDEVKQVAMRGAMWRSVFVSFIIFCMFGAIVLVIWYGVHLKDSGAITTGELITFILYSVFVGASFGGVPDLYAKIQKAIGSTENLMDLLEEQPETISLSGGTAITEISGKIDFNEVSFAYPSRQEVEVLKGVNFTAEDGKSYALVGASGAGKSTIVSLLLRFYDIQQGQILIDGLPIHELDLTELRKNIALVPQEVLLFGGTIKENIAYGKTNATDEEIIDAAKKANAHEFIESFPQGYETLVGERGIQLSGGQRQRIAVARAVLKDPKILILDEATSALDSVSERLVQEALEKLMKGRTTIVIAHRFATIKKVDEVIVLQDGKVVEKGTHEELSSIPNGFYKELSRLQFSQELEINE
jgi:ABC-type multidrug transport system fused ATPase/permease subunit